MNSFLNHIFRHVIIFCGCENRVRYFMIPLYLRSLNSFFWSFIYSFIDSFIHSFIHSFSHSFIRPFIFTVIHWFVRFVWFVHLPDFIHSSHQEYTSLFKMLTSDQSLMIVNDSLAIIHEPKSLGIQEHKENKGRKHGYQGRLRVGRGSDKKC